MLTPRQIEALADAVVDAYASLDTAMRVQAAKGLFRDLDRTKVIAAIQRAGSPREIERAISATYLAAAGADAEADRKLYAVARAAGLVSPSIPAADEASLRGILGMAITGAQQTHNLVLTSALNAIVAEYTDVLDKAMLDVAIGAQSYDSAIAHAVDTLSRTQTAVTYANVDGKIRTDTLYTAVRRNVITGVAQTTDRLVNSRMDYYGVEWVQISAHAGARPEHAVWQGQVMRRIELPMRTGYGTVTGLLGIGCRHTQSAFFPGVSTPTDYGYLDSLDNDAEYGLSQLQRKAERNVRTYRARGEIYDAGGQTAKAGDANLRADGWYKIGSDASKKRRGLERLSRVETFAGEARWPD